MVVAAFLAAVLRGGIVARRAARGERERETAGNGAGKRKRGEEGAVECCSRVREDVMD